MEIQRTLINQLADWKNRPQAKPLVLQGARQTGKTWLLKQFGRDNFDNTAYFNFERQPALKQFFQESKNPAEIITKLSLVNGAPVKPGATLIVFDEIQECTEALNTLKYFNEEAPDYRIACAGSLLGVAMARGASFPVGKVEFLTLRPLTFSEFLKAADPVLLAYLESIIKPEPIPDIFFNPLRDRLQMYFISGGMPEAAVTLLADHDVAATQQVLQQILESYTLDFSKHVAKHYIQKIYYIWNSLPSQLARENKKFLYQTVKSGARARDYEEALNWLVQAGFVHKVYAAAKPGLPLPAYDDLSSFKVYLNDVGLLRRLAMLDPAIYGQSNRLFTEFKGMLTENFILTSLAGQFEALPRFWRSGNSAEVDFLFQHQNQVFPVEVKADENVKSRSLSLYRSHFNPPLSIRFSMRNLNAHDGLINLPLFMVDFVRKFIELNML